MVGFQRRSTLHEQKITMNVMIWIVIGMSLSRNESVRQLINKLDIVVDYGARWIIKMPLTFSKQHYA
ncbi:transposase domain-containing protein [Rheinheimera sp. WS51]|uniref:transposase domain-containing protein n=1 Tax=Rheinheimera sp. WS51 TaxID=3425886 RepID=UPI003D8A6B87